jgi:hypothetical protein
MTTKLASSKGVALAVAAFAVSLALGCGGGSPTGTRTSGRLPQAPATKSTPAAETGPLAGAMEIRLELPKDRYDVSDSVDVRIVFHNTGRVPLKIEYVVAPNVSGFAEFVVLGDKGSQYMTNWRSIWDDPSDYLRRSAVVPAGGNYVLQKKSVLSLKSLNGPPGERYEVFAIYRGVHDATASGEEIPYWSGMAVSAPVVILDITYNGTGSAEDVGH